MSARPIRGKGGRSRVGSTCSTGRGDMSIDDYEFVVGTDGLDQLADDMVADGMVATPSPGSYSRVRGISISSEMPRSQGTRPLIVLTEAGLFKKTEVRRDVLKIFRTTFVGPWAHYKDVPDSHFTMMLDRVRLLYSWPPHIDADVLLAIRRAVMSRYSNTMSDARKYVACQLKAIEGIEFDNYDYRMLIPYPPEWIMNEYWVQMIDRAWNKDEFRRLSKTNTSNRNTEYRGKTSSHYGRYITTAMHRDRMREAWGREPTGEEVNERLNCTNRKLIPGATGPSTDPPIYSYPKAADVADTYGHIRAEEYPDLPPDAVPPNDSDLWKRSVGGRRKSRYFGFETKDPEYVMSGISGAATSGSFHHDEEWDALREDVRQEKEVILKMEEEARQDREARKALEEEAKQDREARKALEEKVKKFEAFMMQFGSSPAPSSF